MGYTSQRPALSQREATGVEKAMVQSKSGIRRAVVSETERANCTSLGGADRARAPICLSESLLLQLRSTCASPMRS